MSINFENIIRIIARQFNTLFSQPDKPYTDYNLKVGNEQYFIENPLEKDEIGIAVHFGEGSIDYGNVILPVVLECIGLPNEIEITQLMLTDYALDNNNTSVDGIKMFFNAPSKQQSFVEYGHEFRSLWIVNASFNVSSNNADITLKYKNGNVYENIEYEQIVYDYGNSPLPEATSDSNGVNITTIQAQTRTLTLVIEGKNDSQFLYDCIYYAKTTLNHDFIFNISFDLSTNIAYDETFKLSDLKIEKRLASNLSITLVFVK